MDEFTQCTIIILKHKYVLSIEREKILGKLENEESYYKINKSTYVITLENPLILKKEKKCKFICEMHISLHISLYLY